MARSRVSRPLTVSGRFVTAALALTTAAVPAASAAPATATWRNVNITAGGFVDGWTRINTGAQQWGWIGQSITGDPNVYGLVYVGTNGRGIQYASTANGGGR